MQLANTLFTILTIAMTAVAAPTEAPVQGARTPPSVTECKQGNTAICCSAEIGNPLVCNLLTIGNDCGGSNFCCPDNSGTVNVRSALLLCSERTLTSCVICFRTGSSSLAVSLIPAAPSSISRLFPSRNKSALSCRWKWRSAELMSHCALRCWFG